MTPTRPTDYELALRALARTGVDTEAARALFQADPSSVTRLAATGAELWADEETAKAQAAFEASDEGKRLSAQKLLARELDITARRKEARALARAAGAPDVEQMTDRELSGLTGLEIPTIDPPAESLSSMIRNSEPSEEEWAANLEAIDRVSKGGEAA